ncbi:MAG TPA: methyl-accepting chemotaxis protein [Candidatus Rifleibacterium sp.]|nr:methyl-accepting chemotaxis protein [Candidatus Rifleibacterium sp.]HPT47471.1 methyl-accepting chemotaxis protein [Candidatus Rifleibacterium sp.]
MALHSLIINKNASSQRNLWILAVLIGLALGCASAGIGLFLLTVPQKVKITFIGASIALGLLTGCIIGWFGSEVLRGIVLFISSDLTTKVGLKSDTFVSTKTGTSKDLDLFDQMFRLVLSVLKRVLLISFKLEVASSDLDKTAQLSSQVIKEIVEGVGAINQKAGDNATNLRETISSLENSFSLSKDISSKLIIAKEDSRSVSEIAGSTQISVKEAVQKMLKIKELTDGSASLVNDLNDRSKQIGTILTEIANIAEKTNLLALNAAIEAARAGEQGRGFAVVAEEVRKLARGSAESSKKINTLINDILQKTENAAEMMQNNTIQVNQGMQVVSMVESSLGSMVQTTNQLNNIIKDISTSAERQSETSDIMYQKVNTISQITDDISLQIQNIATTALGKTVIIDQTSSSARELRTLSDVFQNALVPFDFQVEGANKRSAIRTETRVPCKFKVLLSGELIDSTLSGSDFEMRGVIINLSAGGCVVETNEDVEQGKYIILTFQIGSNFIQGIQGRLVRLKAAVSSSESFLSEKRPVKECIVSFNNVSTEHEKVIVDFVMSAQRQFEINLGLLE